ncbi:hypothetical protein BSKO_11150 [Bryopsis sp. KO-2023]|nr:hypothetical protein BSKO_11150 [Bryopsis sp. KO-2023]
MSSAKSKMVAGKNSSKDIDLTRGEWSNQRHSVEATAKEGYMCHITMNAQLDLTPEQMFAIFTHPDNSHIFRDLGRTVKYKVLEDTDDGVRQKLEIEQQAVFKFLAIPIKFSTKLLVDVDFENLKMSFKLAKWGTMRKFEGHWDMEPLLGEDGEVVGTKAMLTQDVLPLIVPPLLKGFLSGVSANVVRRLLEDLETVAKRVTEGENISKILGDTKWMAKNPALQKWRQKMEAQWEKDIQEKSASGQGSENVKETDLVGVGEGGAEVSSQTDEAVVAPCEGKGCCGDAAGGTADVSSENDQVDEVCHREGCCGDTADVSPENDKMEGGSCEGKDCCAGPAAEGKSDAPQKQVEENCSAGQCQSRECGQPASNSLSLEV